MTAPKHEKRATRRFPLTLPVQLRYSNGGAHELDAQTRDVSARGVCFYVDQHIEEGSAIDFVLTLPTEITLTEPIRVRCIGTVVRVEPAGLDGRMSVAAVIDKYEFCGES